VCARCVEQGFCHFDTRSGVKRIPDVEGHNDAVILLFLKEGLKTVNISVRASAVEA
jgi:hypothetical protein